MLDSDKRLIKLDEEKEYFLDIGGALFSVFYDSNDDELILRGYKQTENGFEMLFEEVIDTAGV